MNIYLDSDAQAVYPQALRAAQQYGLELYVITRDYLDADVNVHLILAEDRQPNCGTWIEGNILRGDICVTANPEIAANCIRKGATALTPLGSQWKDGSLSDDVRGSAVRVTERWANPRTFREHLERAIVTRGIGSRSVVTSRGSMRETTEGSQFRASTRHLAHR